MTILVHQECHSNVTAISALILMQDAMTLQTFRVLDFVTKPILFRQHLRGIFVDQQGLIAPPAESVAAEC